MSHNKSHPRPIFRVALFLVCAILIFLAFNTLYSFTNTLHQLDLVEAERDQWQRPLKVLQGLNLREGNTVADLGSGAGYFTLKLSSAVSKHGQVLAVDLRRMSLFFLWTRAILRGQRNIYVIVGEEDNPRLPTGSVDAVLICNTYHEFGDPEQMLSHIFLALRPGGHAVVVDRAPRSNEVEHPHEMPLAGVADALRKMGFEIASQEDHFIDRPGDDSWWLLVARKP